MSFQPTTGRVLCRLELQALAALIIAAADAWGLPAYRENFDKPGRPVAPAGMTWSRVSDLCPVDWWRRIIPGDGYAYLTVLRSRLVRLPAESPKLRFQTLKLGPVGPGHRFTMRAKDAVIPGVASMIFTHREAATLDEIDIELAAHDSGSCSTAHGMDPGGGWNDIRLNVWAGADPETLVPTSQLRMPIRDARGAGVSHRDGRFHTYTIEWGRESVRFLIDGVEQATVTDLVPQGTAELHFGLRQVSWAGEAGWSGFRTMLVDWVAIEPLADSAAAHPDVELP